MRYLQSTLVLTFLAAMTLQAQTQIGGGVCATSTLSGTYFYLLSGTVSSGNQLFSYAELGKLVADGQGGVSGQSHTSVAGSIAAHSLVGTYSVQASCTGSMTLSVDSQSSSPLTFQLVNGGQEAIVAFSGASAVVAGPAYRQTAASAATQCGAASLSAGYAYLLAGVVFQSGNGFFYSDAGNLTSDGRGNLSVTSFVNANGTILTTTGQGSYSLATDCSGTARVTDQNGTANYFIAVVEAGQAVLFMESDTGTIVQGTAQPQFVAPQAAIVNGGSFDAQKLSPGAIFSIFGTNLSQQPASTRVVVNGEVAPMFFANQSQVNAQMPFDIATDRPASVTITNAGVSSNAVAVTIHQAAPGIFTFGQNRAVVQNPDGSVNSSGAPAHPGDVVVMYLTGGGAVNPAIATGATVPAAPLSTVNSPYSFTVGGSQTEVTFFGLTPGFVGLYQANLRVPALAPGDYPILATVDGEVSNGPVISVAR